MKHLGDVTKIDGTKIEPVWCCSFGSPCQDLSVAGKRAGLQGERSGLFTEATRIIKEMRSIERSDVDIRLPRYALWENVPGALSSNKGDDFRVVLEELARIEDPEFNVPRCEKKWSKSGVIIGDTWSIAWRIHDAQFWGVPQRRKRISVLCDFDGHTAPDILFSEYYREACEGDRHTSVMGIGDGYRSEIQLESEGCTRHLESCNEAWKGIARDPEESIGIDHSCTLQVRGGCDGGGKGALIQDERTGALSTVQDKTLF